MQMIFQDSMAAFNPKMKIIDIITEPLMNYGLLSNKNKKQRAEELLEMVELSKEYLYSYPHNVSGGQLQRVGIARALANDAKILLCDEATSALDPQTTSSILDLLKRLNKDFGITIVLITHELDVVKQICDRVALMSNGAIVEIGSTYDIFSGPNEEFSKEFIKHEQELTLPDSILKRMKGRIVNLRYSNHNATEPILHKIANENNVEINIIHARMEYINDFALGTLFVELLGEDKSIESVIEGLKEAGVGLEVIK